MKNNKMFIILSIVALSASFAHATLQENFKQAVEQIKAKLANDQEVNELVQAIAKQAASFQLPKDARYEERKQLREKWQAEIEQLPSFQRLAAKIKENLPEKTLKGIEEIKKLNKISEERDAEMAALSEIPEYKNMESLLKQFHEDVSKIREKPKYKVLSDRREDRYASSGFIYGLAENIDNEKKISANVDAMRPFIKALTKSFGLE